MDVHDGFRFDDLGPVKVLVSVIVAKVKGLEYGDG